MNAAEIFFASLPVVAIDEFTITAHKGAKGSCFAKFWNVDKNGKPFAQIGLFTAAHGGNYGAGNASGANGGRFDTYEAAEAWVRGL